MYIHSHIEGRLGFEHNCIALDIVHKDIVHSARRTDCAPLKGVGVM